MLSCRPKCGRDLQVQFHSAALGHVINDGVPVARREFDAVLVHRGELVGHRRLGLCHALDRCRKGNRSTEEQRLDWLYAHFGSSVIVLTGFVSHSNLD